MKTRRRHIGLLIVLIALSAVSTAFAQNTSRAQNSYDTWQSKNQGHQDEREIVIAVSAIKYEDVGATIDIVVGVGSGITKLDNLEFSVKPVAIAKGDNGEAVFQELSGGGSIKTYQAYENIEVEAKGKRMV